MSVAIKTRAIALLADFIECEVPDLKGRICVGPAEPSHKLAFPSLAIVPIRFKYLPDQAMVLDEDGPTAQSAILNVGRHEGLVQLRLGATTASRRAELEQEVLDAFLSRPLSPGVLVFEVKDCHDATVAFELEDDSWQDEAAFDQKWYSVIAITAQIPALVRRGETYTLKDLRLSLTEDLTTPFADLSADAVETVQIDELGDITASTP